MLNRTQRRAHLLSACVVGILTAAAATAQEAVPPPSATPAEAADPNVNAQQVEALPSQGLEEVVVTGSRLRRTEFDSVSPIMVVTREETTLAGFSSLSESLQSNTVTGGTAQINNAYGGYVTNGGPGANTIGLRGLGAGRTLVLLNGRRVAPAGSRGSVGSADLNVLPNAMIERVEVLRDGASSIYGSDAIAGVINIITRDLNGTTIEAQNNSTGDGGGGQTRFSLTSGMSGDNWSLAGSAEYYHREDLTLADRDWTRCQTDRYYNEDGSRADYIDPATGKFKCYSIREVGSSGVTINTIGTASRPGVAAPGTTGTSFGRWRPNADVTTGLVGFEGVSTNSRDTFEKRMLNESLISPADVFTGYLQGTYELQALGGAELYGEVLLNRRESEQTGYRQLSIDYGAGSALLPSTLNTLPNYASSDIAPAGYAVRAFVGYGNDHSEQSVGFYKGTVGLRGDLPFGDWRYDGYATYSKSDADYQFESALIDRMVRSLDVVANGDGTFRCADTSGGCVAAPALTPAVIGGALPKSWLDYVWRPIDGTTTYDETVASATIDGSLFDLPAGSVGAAFGLEYRHASIDDVPSIHSQNANLYGFTSSATTQGSDSVWEAYAEVELPLLNDLPAVDDLSLNLSGRYTNYDSYGSDTTYKAALSWVATDWFSVRATYGTSYRAPALFEQFQGATSGFAGSGLDPCDELAEIDPASQVYQNCIADGLPPNFTSTSSVEVITLGGADVGLEAETSDNFTAGIVLQPVMGDSWGTLQIAVDYYDIQIDNGVAQAGESEILTRCYSDADFASDNGYCRLVTRNSDRTLTVYDSYINLSTQVVTGIDYTVRYGKAIGPGEFTTDLRLSQFLEQKERLFADDPWDDVNGTLNNPDWSGEVDLTYEWDAWRVRWSTEWVAAMDSYEYYFEDKTANLKNTGYDLAVPDYFLHDVSVEFTSDDKWSITGGVRNVFDEEPPAISTSQYYNRVGNAPLYSGYDYLGRQYFVNVSMSF
jgi:outer membrane receptor protein involved in Fe transport